MEEDADNIFYDTISINSGASSVRRDRNSIGLSRNTIYHSAEDLELLTMANESPLHRGKLSKAWNRFRDGEKCIDFVLAYAPLPSNDAHDKKRKTFERHLVDEGLVLESEETQHLHFVKIHAPFEVLARYCEILKLRMPIKKLEGQEYILDPSFDIRSLFSKLPDCLKVRLDTNTFPREKYRLTAEFSRDKNYLFDVESENFFTTAVRTMIVHFILQRQRFTDDPHAHFDVGIDRLLAAGVYKAAYPLHDGDIAKKGCMRSLLYTEWAQVSKWIKYQPIDCIKDYFGVRYALYFAWLGFYTHMLIPAAIVGLVCFFYGLATLSSNRFSNDICDPSLNVTMCPLCDTYCDYWNLTDACTYSRINYLFDNSFTVAFAIFMSFWAALYLELWKRYSAEITHRWGMTGYDPQAEHPRPEYLARLTHAKKQKVNVVTRVLEPVVPFWKVKFPSVVLSFSIALLWVLLAVAAVFGVVVFRMAQLTSRNIHTDVDTDEYRVKVITVPIVAAIINLICIMVLNTIYDRLALVLTEMELQRTQTEFDDSLTLKIYMFQFVNYYSCIFYLAFLKGKFVGYPSKYNRVFGYRQEECSPGGCLMELCIQLAIVMIGNQAMNGAIEMIVPFLTKWYNTFRVKTGLAEEEESDLICCNQWTEDFKLLAWGQRGLFEDYLEMVLQYGFITIFVAAFPLAPLFALVNNVFEMRLDAKKFIKFYRRPVPCRVKNIGVWLPILGTIGRIAVITNAFIIAFSSNFIPRLVYMLVVNPAHNDAGFLNHTLAYFDTNDFQVGAAPTSPSSNVSLCRYSEYRNPPWHDRKYKRPLIYWHILAVRLLFVVLFQNVVGLVINVVQWAIPDQSRKLRDQIKREAYLTSEIIINKEMIRSKDPARSESFRNNRKPPLETDIEMNTLRNRYSDIPHIEEV